MTILTNAKPKFVTRLTAAANALSLPVSERSHLEPDGSVRGITYEFSMMGDVETVTRAINQLFTETFRVNATAVCDYRYLNMPGKYYRPNGQEPRKLSSDEFMRTFESGKHVYLGEQAVNIFLIPIELALEMPVTWDSTILYTDVRKLGSDVVKRVRAGK